jgi:sRNA-binding protein
MNQEQYIKAIAAIERLAALYPQAFFVYERRRRPLKIGIHHNIIAAGVMEPDELTLALDAYTQNIGYLCNLREGVERIDLSGNPVDVVTAKHAAGAASWAKARMQRKLEMKCKALRKATHKRYVEAWETVAKLQALYPLAFFVKGKSRRPLKLDIVKDIVGADIPENELENALSLYMGSPAYLKNLKEGVERVDLAGEPTGVSVTADEAAAATAYLERIERREAVIPQVVAPPIPETVVVMQQPAEAAQPKRQLSGLADLKAAAMARRNVEAGGTRANMEEGAR